MKVYLDDRRRGPNNDDFGHGPAKDDWNEWVIVRSVENLKTLLTAGLVDDLSLDHDMGADPLTDELYPSGMALVKWMAENHIWPKGGISIHSSNKEGARNMKSYIDSYFKVHNEE